MIRWLISFRRIAAQGFRNFFRNAWLSSAATAIMVVTLTIILSAVVINMALTDTIDDIASNVTVSVYLQDDITEEQRNELQQTLEQSFNVANVDYVSKEEALAIFQERNRDDPSLIEGISVTDNVLPASLEVEVDDLSQIDAVTAVAEEDRFEAVVDETSVSEERRASIDNIARAQDFITFASIIAAAIFAGISILVIFNTIRMAVFTRSDEIEIMKLIGATPNYIRGPFLFEAAMYGVIAGLLAASAVYSVLLSLGPRADRQLLIGPTIDRFAEWWPLILLGTIMLGMLIGLASSLISMSRYLRLKSW
jgi:cell division transport system permease protein